MASTVIRERAPGLFGYWIFHVGDLVTRDGTDVHQVIDAGNGQLITVECVKAPADGWCAVGEREDNLARRYEFASQYFNSNELAEISEHSNYSNEVAKVSPRNF